MATANLTKRVVEELQYSPGCDYFVWDAKLKGFGVRVTERSGKDGTINRRKVFLIGYRPRGSRRFRRLTLGAFGPVTVDQARGAARQHLGAISAGSDPLESQRLVKAQRTVREMGVAYLADVRARRKKSTAAGYGQMWDAHALPSLGSRKVVEVTTSDIRRIHRGLQATPYLANRVAALLGAFFTFAAKEGARPAHDNPAHGIEFYPEQARERFLTAAEFGKLGAALATAERVGLPPAPNHRRKAKSESKRKHVPKSAAEPIPANPFAVAAIRLLALTGCRENEVLSLRWDAVDFREWLPTTGGE